jgi:hypothetical protein
MGLDRRNFSVSAGETFIPTIRWATSSLVGRAITGISQTAPAVVTAAAHGVPAGWPCAVVSAKGMTQINSPRYPPRAPDWHAATVLSPDTILLDDINSADFSPYTSGGFVVFNTPMSLVGVTARMVIRDAPGGLVLATLTDQAGITLNTTTFTIMPRLETAGLAWAVGYYDLELTDTSATITQLLSGTITIE